MPPLQLILNCALWCTVCSSIWVRVGSTFESFFCQAVSANPYKTWYGLKYYSTWTDTSALEVPPVPSIPLISIMWLSGTCLIKCLYQTSGPRFYKLLTCCMIFLIYIYTDGPGLCEIDPRLILRLSPPARCHFHENMLQPCWQLILKWGKKCICAIKVECLL